MNILHKRNSTISRYDYSYAIASLLPYWWMWIDDEEWDYQKIDLDSVEGDNNEGTTLNLPRLTP